MKKPSLKTSLIVAGVLGLTAIGATQVREIIKIMGVGALVTQFGPDINKGFNSLSGHKDRDAATTKVVPIITVGVNSRGAIGAAQVMGTRKQVEKVKAIAALEADILGKEVKIRALIPVEAENITDKSKVRAVEGVGVSGIVDLRL